MNMIYVPLIGREGCRMLARRNLSSSLARKLSFDSSFAKLEQDLYIGLAYGNLTLMRYHGLIVACKRLHADHDRAASCLANLQAGLKVVVHRWEDIEDKDEEEYEDEDLWDLGEGSWHFKLPFISETPDAPAPSLLPPWARRTTEYVQVGDYRNYSGLIWVKRRLETV